MEQETRPILQTGIVRCVFVALALVAQIAWIYTVLTGLYAWSELVQLAVTLLSLFVVFYVFGAEQNSSYRTLWIIVLLAFPVFGLMLYGIFSETLGMRVLRRRFERVDSSLEGSVTQDAQVLLDLKDYSRQLHNQAQYLVQTGAPVYQNTDVVYYAEASDGFKAQLEAIDAATEFVFMEYHAIEDSHSFKHLRAALERKAAQGVEIRIVYDDMGSIGFINTKFVADMESIGVQCRVFNPLVPTLRAFMNNRDHRKITVVDGRVGFTGGYNLADEYFNIVHPYGLWKDTGVRLEGDAVRSLTVCFLEMWNAIDNTDLGRYNRYLPTIEHEAQPRGGWVQPYGDSPFDTNLVAEDVYLNAIKYASERLWATTPYLIIDDEMTRELTLAARRGVDVRIVTPGIPDKPFIYKVTRSYYAQLARHGVRIYEWQPGFLHAKQMLADDQLGLVGTINLDYRSLYLHFENGVALYGCPALRDMEACFKELFAESREVTALYANEKNGPLSLSRRALRLIAPLL